MSKFCVIGRDNAKVDAGLQRRYFDTETEATMHAEGLLRRQLQKSQMGPTKSMLVCEIKAIVEVKTAPIATRPLQDADLIPFTGEDVE